MSSDICCGGAGAGAGWGIGTAVGAGVDADAAADAAVPVDEPMRIASNIELAPAIHMMELHAPQVARAVRPGQFVHMQIPGMDGHILRRPFSVCRWEGDSIFVMYQVVGAGSRHMTTLKPGQELRAIGPVGRGWNPPAGTRHAVLVCGGMGVAPQTMLAKQLVESGAHVDCLVGATTAQRLVGTSVLEGFGARVHIATDDGSIGHHGFCTDLIGEFCSDANYISICGPEPMERAAVRVLDDMAGADGLRGNAPENLLVEVSLERRMACGIGACLSCVVDTVYGKRRACVDGPVFNAREVVWQ